jgi:hypothetical protein
VTEEAKSIVFTEKGLQEADRLLEKLFSKDKAAGARQPGERI